MSITGARADWRWSPERSSVFLPRLALIAGSLILLMLIAGVSLAAAGESSVSAKQFPVGYFYKYQKSPIKEKEQVLARIDATLKRLNQEGYGLIAKGAVIGKLGTAQKIYPQLTILDESGLIIKARNVPNLYYLYPGKAPLNPNIYLIIRKAGVNFQESYIRYGFVVEGDFVAYAHKFVTAILENLENATIREDLPPAGPAVEGRDKGRLKR